MQRHNLDFASCLCIYCMLALNLKSWKKRRRNWENVVVTNLNKSRMAGKKKTQPAARKCLSVCTICCWYSLNGKYLCCVFLFTLLCSFRFCFHRNHNYISANFRKDRPHQAEQSCRKPPGGSHSMPLRREQPRDTGSLPLVILLSQGNRPGIPCFHTSLGHPWGNISLAHVYFYYSKPLLWSVYRNGALGPRLHCSWKTSSSRLQFKIHRFFFSFPL